MSGCLSLESQFRSGAATARRHVQALFGDASGMLFNVLAVRLLLEGEECFSEDKRSSFCHGLSWELMVPCEKLWVLHNKECMVVKQG